MKEKLKRMLTNNLGLKILSVVLAVFTWLIMVNVSNPLVTVTQTVPVEFTNESVLKDAGLTYESMSRGSVTVSYKIHVRDESRVSANDFAAYADLAQLYDVTGAIPVQTEITSFLARSLVQSGSVSANPPVVRVQTEPIQTKTFVLEVHIEGTPAEGYETGETVLTPPYVSVTGAESAVGQISSLGVEISVEDADADLSGEAPVCFYDANGNQMKQSEKITLDTAQASYNVTMLLVKELAIDYKVTGTAADGYRFRGVESDIDSITVVGLRSALAGLNTLEISDPSLDLNSASGDVVSEIDLTGFLPEGVSVVDDQPAMAMVTLRVEQLETRIFEYDVGSIDLTGQRNGYEYIPSAPSLVLQIRGLAEDLDELDADRIRVRIDVSRMEPGARSLRPTVELEDGFELMGVSEVLVTVRDTTVQTEPESTAPLGPASAGESMGEELPAGPAAPSQSESAGESVSTETSGSPVGARIFPEGAYPAETETSSGEGSPAGAETSSEGDNPEGTPAGAETSS